MSSCLPGASQSCTVKHQVCPSNSLKLFLGAGPNLNQTQSVFCPSALPCVPVWLVVIPSGHHYGRTQAQDHKVFPSLQTQHLPYPRDVSDIKGAILWIFAISDEEAQRMTEEVRLDSLTSSLYLAQDIQALQVQL